MRLRREIDYRNLTRAERPRGVRFKYVLLRLCTQRTIIKPEHRLQSRSGLVVLETTGQLTICTGFRWDGPSGPTWDTPTTMRAALVHDALYLLMREGLLDQLDYRLVADGMLYRIMIEDGAWKWRATLWLWTVWAFAASAAAPIIRS